MNNKQWAIVSLIILSLGVAFLTVNFLVFVPRYQALSEAVRIWAQNVHLNKTVTPPAFETYQLGINEMMLSQALGGTGYLLVIAGLIYPVVLLVTKVAKKVKRIE